MYKPDPINTANIRLPEEILELAELLAKNTHEIWAQNRIAEGWTYGNTRDDEALQSPCLVPYEELPESEKDYDRSTSQEVLKVLYTLGYRIEKNDVEGRDHNDQKKV